MALSDPTSHNSSRTNENCAIQYSLEGHQGKLMDVLYCQWLEESLLCDLQLRTFNGIVRVHTCVIIAFSPRIAEVISLKEQNRRKTKSMEYCIDVQFDYHVIKSIIKSIYSGNFVTDISLLQEICKALEWLGIEELAAIAKVLKQSMCVDIDVVDIPYQIGKLENLLCDELPQEQEIDNDQPETDVNLYSGRTRKKNKRIPGERTKKPKKSLKKSMTSKKKLSDGSKKKRDQKGKLPCVDVEGKKDAEELLINVGRGDFNLNAVKTEILDVGMSIVQLESEGKKCSKCKAFFTDMDEYQSHTNDHPTFACDQCSNVYFSSVTLCRHMRQTHFQLYHLNCSLCEFTAKNHSQFREHCVNVHQITKPFHCKFEGCQYQSDKYRSLSQHFQMHEGFRNFKCDKCNKPHNSWGALHSHKRSCFHAQKYLCDLCGQPFNHLNSMKLHRRTMHLGEKPFKCKVCAKQFTEGSNLRRHMRIHNNAYPYSCTVCNRAFRHSNMLKSHINQHGKSDTTNTTANSNSISIISNSVSVGSLSLGDSATNSNNDDDNHLSNSKVLFQNSGHSSSNNDNSLLEEQINVVFSNQNASSSTPSTSTPDPMYIPLSMVLAPSINVVSYPAGSDPTSPQSPDNVPHNPTTSLHYDTVLQWTT